MRAETDRRTKTVMPKAENENMETCIENSTRSANGHPSLVLGCRTTKICKNPNKSLKWATVAHFRNDAKRGPGKRPENVRDVTCDKRSNEPHFGAKNDQNLQKAQQISEVGNSCPLLKIAPKRPPSASHRRATLAQVAKTPRGSSNATPAHHAQTWRKGAKLHEKSNEVMCVSAGMSMNYERFLPGNPNC